MPGATVIVPSAFIVIAPVAGVGAVPGVKVISAGSTTAPFSVSFAKTVEIVAPAEPFTDGGVSAMAAMGAVPTVTVTVVVSQLVGLRISQIWYG